MDAPQVKEGYVHRPRQRSLFAALLAREHGTVVILTKGKIDDCNSRYAQGGVAAAVGSSDSPELHMQDTLAAGAGLPPH